MQNLADNMRREALRWDDVRYFLELSRHGTLSAAARELAVEHSTVARRVTALEQRIGIRLFNRLPKSWQLTPEGEELLQHAQRIEQEADAFSRATLGVSALTGVVRLSVPPAFASHFLLTRLADIRRQWPAIALDITAETREANLFRREADLALRLSRPDEPGLAARAIGTLGYGLYGAPAWRALPPERREFIGYDDSLRDAPQQRWLEKLAGQRPFVIRSNDLATLHQACRSGLGLAVLPHFMARHDAALVAVAEADCPVTRKLWMVTHPDVRRSPRVRAISDFVAGIVHDAAALLE